MQAKIMRIKMLDVMKEITSETRYLFSRYTIKQIAKPDLSMLNINDLLVDGFVI
jgi:hypothetical protein